MESVLSKLIKPLFLGLLALCLAAPSFAAAEADCPGLFRRAWRKSSGNFKLAFGKATSRLDAKSFEIFEKVRVDASAELNPEELAHLKAKGLSYLFRRYRESNSAIKKFNELVALNNRSRPMYQSMKIKRDAIDLGMTAVFPGLPVAPTKMAERIFTNALKKNDYRLTKDEADFLAHWDYLEDFRRFAAEAPARKGAFMMATRIRNTGNGMRWGLISALAGGSAAIPYFGAERVETAEELHAKTESLKGGIQLIFGEEPDDFAILRNRNQAVMMKGNEAKFFTGDKLKELEAKLSQKDSKYNQIFLRANLEEINKVMNKAKEFVTRKRELGGGKLELDQRMFWDAPLSESYKILQAELGLPPAPLFKRNAAIVLSYFGAMKALGNAKDGRVREVLRVRTSEKPESEVSEAFSRAFEAYLSGVLFAGARALPAVAIGGIDLMPNTLRKKTVRVKTEREPSKESPAKARNQEDKDHRAQGIIKNGEDPAAGGSPMRNDK